MPREVFSITKSVTSALVGIAIRDGDLRLDDRVSTYVPQWRGTASETVTVRNLLSNDSGRILVADVRLHRPAQGPEPHALRRRAPPAVRPGSAWAYNNAAIQVLEPVLEQATGMRVATFARTRLFEPLGMAHSTFITDRADDAAVFYGLRTTCLDIARFGMLYLGDGAVDGNRLLDRSFVKRSVGRSSTTHNAAYGYLWWLNRPGSLRGRDRPGGCAGPAAPPGHRPAGTVRARGRLRRRSASAARCCSSTRRSQTMVIRLGLPAQPGAEAYGLDDAATGAHPRAALRLATSRARRGGAAAGSRRR